VKKFYHPSSLDGSASKNSSQWSYLTSPHEKLTFWPKGSIRTALEVVYCCTESFTGQAAILTRVKIWRLSHKSVWDGLFAHGQESTFVRFCCISLRFASINDLR
jgi:hypothetical protein